VYLRSGRGIIGGGSGGGGAARARRGGGGGVSEQAGSGEDKWRKKGR